MGGIEQFIPLILIFAIMYFLMIRPQQKKIKEHQKMVQNLRRGDVVVTQGGLIGKVAKVKENNELDGSYGCRKHDAHRYNYPAHVKGSFSWQDRRH